MLPRLFDYKYKPYLLPRNNTGRFLRSSSKSAPHSRGELGGVSAARTWDKRLPPSVASTLPVSAADIIFSWRVSLSPYLSAGSIGVTLLSRVDSRLRLLAIADESYALDDCPNVVSAPRSSSKGLLEEKAPSERSGEALTTLIPRPSSLDMVLKNVCVTLVIVCRCECNLGAAVVKRQYAAIHATGQVVDKMH